MSIIIIGYCRYIRCSYWLNMFQSNGYLHWQWLIQICLSWLGLDGEWRMAWLLRQYTYIYIYVYIHTHHTYIYMYIYIYTHIYTGYHLRYDVYNRYSLFWRYTNLKTKHIFWRVFMIWGEGDCGVRCKVVKWDVFQFSHS